jgi:secreted trypsin-like serine protease
VTKYVLKSVSCLAGINLKSMIGENCGVADIPRVFTAVSVSVNTVDSVTSEPASGENVILALYRNSSLNCKAYVSVGRV